MPVDIDDVVHIIEAVAPPDLAYAWDNTGLLLRCGDQVAGVMVALDVTNDVIDAALKQGCDMILCHHPLIFEPVKTISCTRRSDALLMRLIRHHMSLYAAHTSYDRAQGGINDCLSEKLGLNNVEIAAECGDDLMRMGYLPKPCSQQQFIAHVKQALGVETIKISESDCDCIDKVVVVGGSGGDFVTAAKKNGAKALITGEAKHHHHLEAQSYGLLLVEAGHHETEVYFTGTVFMSLQSRLNALQLDLGLKRFNSEKAPYTYC